MDDPTALGVTILRTSDIAAVNAAAHPSWRDRTYLLRPGPFAFESMRISIDRGLRLCRWSCRGAARTVAHLAPGALHVAFPKGTGVRVHGSPLDAEVVTVTLGEAEYSASSLEQVECDELIVSGDALAELFRDSGTDRDGAPSQALWARRCAGGLVLLRTDESACRLRDALRTALDAAADASEGERGAMASAALQHAALLPRLRQMLVSLAQRDDLLAVRAGRRRHALARDAERLIWRRVSGAEPGGLSLDELCTALGTTRRTLQLAFQDHFGTPVGLVTRSARLQQVRAELGSGVAPGVSEAAMRSGFDHLGRFARYYRDFFGESPSATLRGRRGRDRAA